MPFKSKAQQKWMFAQHPEMAKEWASKTDFKHLPEKAKKMYNGGVFEEGEIQGFDTGGYVPGNSFTGPYNKGGIVEDKFSKLKKMWSGGKY
jgi:hypothetical protein